MLSFLSPRLLPLNRYSCIDTMASLHFRVLAVSPVCPIRLPWSELNHLGSYRTSCRQRPSSGLSKCTHTQTHIRKPFFDDDIPSMSGAYISVSAHNRANFISTEAPQHHLEDTLSLTKEPDAFWKAALVGLRFYLDVTQPLRQRRHDSNHPRPSLTKEFMAASALVLRPMSSFLVISSLGVETSVPIPHKEGFTYIAVVARAQVLR